MLLVVAICFVAAARFLYYAGYETTVLYWKNDVNHYVLVVNCDVLVH
jgi:hypothetical protein